MYYLEIKFNFHLKMFYSKIEYEFMYLFCCTYTCIGNMEVISLKQKNLSGLLTSSPM